MKNIKLFLLSAFVVTAVKASQPSAKKFPSAASATAASSKLKHDAQAKVNDAHSSSSFSSSYAATASSSSASISSLIAPVSSGPASAASPQVPNSGMPQADAPMNLNWIEKPKDYHILKEFCGYFIESYNSKTSRIETRCFTAFRSNFGNTKAAAFAEYAFIFKTLHLQFHAKERHAHLYFLNDKIKNEGFSQEQLKELKSRFDQSVKATLDHKCLAEFCEKCWKQQQEAHIKITKTTVNGQGVYTFDV